MDSISRAQQLTTAGKTMTGRILERHQNPVVEDGSLRISKSKDHVGETMLREYQELRDEFIMVHKASNAIGELVIPVDINAQGKTVKASGKAIHIDDDPSTRDEMVIKAETCETIGSGGKSFDYYTMTYQEEGQKLTKIIHHAGHSEDAAGDIMMGGGSEVRFIFDKSTQDVEYENMLGKEIIHQSFSSPASENKAKGAIPEDATRILDADDRVLFGEIALPKNMGELRYFLVDFDQ